MIHYLLGRHFRDRRHNAEDVAGQHNDIVGFGAIAGRLRKPEAET
jgi:hypothetical protein